MEAYLPVGPAAPAAVLAALLLVLALGPWVAGRFSLAASRASSWTLVLLGTASVERICASEPPGFRMLALIAFALLALKVVVLVEERARGGAPLPFGAWLAFAAGWLGMQPRLFARGRAGPLPGARELLVRGTAWLALGALLIVAARCAWTTLHSLTLATLLLLPGLSLAVHLGLCNGLASAWRSRGIACDALFRAPLRSQNLSEFWGRRWNLAFSEMTAIAVYRPLSPRLGRAPALLASFALSGLLHEMAISLPVRAGFGLPFLYFALHGVLVLVEGSLERAGRPLAGWTGRAWAILWLVLPLPILFHRPFLAGVVWPLIGIPR
jgi:membrane bound O-acyltransferase family protein